MSNNKETVADSFPMNGGDGTYSYTKNSYYQRIAASLVDTMIDETICNELDVKDLVSTSNKVFRLADLGCSVGPNTFIAMQNVLESVKRKCLSQGLASQIPEFQVFFNDHASNDFNTLFVTLPIERQYFTAGVPGSFHGRLFPNSSIHFVYSSNALHWLSKTPKECVDIDSPAWNKGRIHYVSAPEAVASAYAAQFADDMGSFLDARAQELVVGGMVVLVMLGLPDGVPYSRFKAGVLFALLESSITDMAKEGKISEAQVDSFNLPMYAASPKVMAAAVEKNGCFSIERLELTDPLSKREGPLDYQLCTMHYRAGFEGILTKHFGNEIMDELFDRFYQKTAEFSRELKTADKAGSQLFVILKRK